MSSERPQVLVVVPDRSARGMLEVALGRDGFEVGLAETAEAGLTAARKGRTPDVIVLASNLEGADGFSFCAELRGDARTARVPVVLLADGEPGNVEALAEVVGVDDAVKKPAFARDIVALARFELVRRQVAPGAALAFGARALPPAHLLRALLTAGRSGVMTLADGRGTLRFSGGVIIDASLATRRGLNAVVGSLRLTTGEYAVRLEPVTRSVATACPLETFVGDVLPRLAKWERVTARSLPLDVVVAVDLGRLVKALPTMPEEVDAVVKLFDGRRRVVDVLVDSTVDEALSLEISTRLYLMGIVGPLPRGAAGATASRSAPRLFEPRSADGDELMRQLFDGLAEIRAADAEPMSLEDATWSVPSAASDLDVVDPAGGWRAAALTQVFGADALDGGPTGPVPSATTDRLPEPDVTPPSSPRRFADDDRQPRVITPVLTPVVSVMPSSAAEPPRWGTSPGALVGSPPAAVAAGATPARSGAGGAPEPSSRVAAPADAEPVSRRATEGALQTSWSTADGAAPAGSGLDTFAPQPARPAPLDGAGAIASATEPLVVDGAATLSSTMGISAMQSAAMQGAATQGPGAAASGTGTLSAVLSPPAGSLATSELEASFFDPAEPGSVDPPTLAPQAGGRGVGVLLLGLALAALLVAVVFEWGTSSARTAADAPNAAPLAPEVPAAPAPAEVTGTPAVNAPESPSGLLEASLQEAEGVDVSESLAEGVRAYQRGEYAKAISWLEQVVADDPRSVQGWLVLGQARYDAGDAKGAREAAAKVLEVEPKHARVHLLFATLAFDTGDKALMRKELETYLSLEPDGPHAAEARTLLAR